MRDILLMVKEVQEYERKRLAKQNIEPKLVKARKSRSLTASIKLLFNNRNGQH